MSGAPASAIRSHSHPECISPRERFWHLGDGRRERDANSIVVGLGISSSTPTHGTRALLLRRRSGTAGRGEARSSLSSATAVPATCRRSHRARSNHVLQLSATSALPRSGSSGPAQPRDRLRPIRAPARAPCPLADAGGGCVGSAPFGSRSRERCNRRAAVRRGLRPRTSIRRRSSRHGASARCSAERQGYAASSIWLVQVAYMSA